MGKWLALVPEAAGNEFKPSLLHSQFEILQGCWKSKKTCSRSQGWGEVCGETLAGFPHLSGTTRCHGHAWETENRAWGSSEAISSGDVAVTFHGEQPSAHSKNGVWVIILL